MLWIKYEDTWGYVQMACANTEKAWQRRGYKGWGQVRICMCGHTEVCTEREFKDWWRWAILNAYSTFIDFFYFISLFRVLSRVQLYFNYSQYYGWRKPVSSRGKPTNIRGLAADFGIWNCNTRVCRRMVIIEVWGCAYKTFEDCWEEVSPSLNCCYECLTEVPIALDGKEIIQALRV